MGIYLLEPFVRQLDVIASAGDLSAAMVEVCAVLGVEHFALTHHVDVLANPGRAIRLHNYPAQWADFYDRNALGVSDPVHRASHVTSVGFAWSQLNDLIPLTRADRRMLALGQEHGIGDGFTVPAHVPGEARGSCSFANRAGVPVAAAMLPLAQLVGAFAFEGARRLWSARPRGGTVRTAVLTDRQRDCVMWAARGKSDWEISRILGVSEETVTRHMKLARERYGVPKRTCLAIRTLFDGTLTFDDVVDRGSTPFWE